MLDGRNWTKLHLEGSVGRTLPVVRRLAAILAADVVGYSRLIEADEEGTLNRLNVLRAELIDPLLSSRGGRVFKTTGDGILAEFASVVDALRCATEVQAALARRNVPLPPERRLVFRIGLNVGDIVIEDGDMLGDGVNLAARLEGLADPGGICVTARVREDVANRLDLAFEDMGEQALKNISRPVRTYRVRTEAGMAPPRAQPAPPLPDKPSIAVLPFANLSGDPEQEYFADGMVEEIITALSRIRWLFVIARNSSLADKAEAIDMKRVGRELGVRYLLEGPEANRRIAIDLARRALRAAGDDAMALAGVAHVLGYFNEDISAAVAIVDRSLALDPSSAYGWRWSGFLRLYAGQPELAIEQFEKSLRLNPRDLGWAQLTGIGIAHFFRGRPEKATEALLQALQENPSYPLANRFLASCYAHAGRLEEAREVVVRLRAITPVIVPAVTNYRDPVHNELYLSGLRAAAGEAPLGRKQVTPPL